MNDFVEEVYAALNGYCRMDGVENAFTKGSKCEKLYGQVYDAQRRLEKRLGVEPYDEDVEMIISALMDIQTELCDKMYDYGAKFGLKDDDKSP